MWAFVHGVPWWFVMYYTSEYSKLYIYISPSISIIIWFINAYSRIESYLYYLLRLICFNIVCVQSMRNKYYYYYKIPVYFRFMVDATSDSCYFRHGRVIDNSLGQVDLGDNRQCFDAILLNIWEGESWRYTLHV